MQLLLNTIMLEPNRWTVDKQLTYSLGELLEPIAAAGFRGLEIWQYHLSSLRAEDCEELPGRLQSLGLRAVALGAYPQFHLEGQQAAAEQSLLDRLVADAARLGCAAFKIFPGRVASADADDELWQLSAERMSRLAEALDRHDIVLTLETHGGTLCDSLDGTLRLLDSLRGCANVGICFQPYLEDDTEAATAAFDTLATRVRHLHLQNRIDGAVSLLADGEWTDYRRFLPHVRDSGFDGLMSLEFTAGITPVGGEPFALNRVIANAVQDREFAVGIWRCRS